MDNEEYNKLDNKDEEKVEITDEELEQYETDIDVEEEDDDNEGEDCGLTRGDKIAFIILVIAMIAGIIANEFFILKN